jgi:hypothetical protein
MLQRDGIAGTPGLDFDAWRALLRSNCGGEVKVTAPNAFAGWMRPLSVCGLAAAAVKIQGTAGDRGCHAHRFERTFHDVRRDGSDHYVILFQMAGQSAMSQIDRTTQLTAGDVALIDAARPVTFSSRRGDTQWLSLRLPRKSVRSHLGFELQGGLRRHETRAGRLLFNLVRDADHDSAFSPSDSYMQLAVCDLVGALFAPSVHVSFVGQAVHADLRRYQGRLLQPGFRTLRGGGRNRNLAALRSKAFYRTWFRLQRIHLFVSAGSCRTSAAPPRAARHRPASQRDRLRLRLSRLRAFRPQVSPPFRRCAGRPCRT